MGEQRYKENRYFFLNDYSEFVKKSSDLVNQSSQKNYAIMYADLTNFQMVNDFYGFTEGDRFLNKFADFLSTSPRTLLCGRVFSDHFLRLSLFEDDIDLEAVTLEYENKVEDFLLQQQSFHPDCKVHVAAGLCYVKKDVGIVKIIDFANIARKEAKKAMRSHLIWFDEEMDNLINRKKTLEFEIQNALRNELFTFHLQPKVNINTGKIVGSEALARLIKDGRIIYPDEFVAIMEENETILDLDFLICKKVCQYLYNCIKKGLPLIPISINMSRMHVHQIDFVDRINRIVEGYHIPPHLLEFELTETAIVHNISKIAEVMDKMRSLGYKVSIDDYGSGYTGMNIWQELKFDVVKLDKSYLDKRKITNNHNDIIIPSIVDICQKLQVTIVVEGAETEEECLYMSHFGCHVVQGYYFCKPIPCEQFDQLVAQNNGYFALPWTQEDVKMSLVENISEGEVRSITNSIFNILPGGVAGFDLEGDLIFISDSLSQLTGYSKEELVGENISHWQSLLLMNEDDYQTIYKQFYASVNHDGKTMIEMSLRNKAGNIIYVNLYGGVVNSPEWGTYLLCCFYDVSEMKETSRLIHEKQAELSKVEHDLETVIKNTPGDIIEAHIHENQLDIHYLSHGLKDSFGYTQEEFEAFLEKDNGFELIYKDDRQAIFDCFIEYAHKKQSINKDYRVCYKDGSVGWHNVKANYYEGDEDIVYHGIVTSINSRRQQERELEDYKNKYQFILKMLGAEICDYDFYLDRFSFLYSQELLLDSSMQSFSLQEFIETKLIHPDDVERFKGLLNDVHMGAEEVFDRFLLKENDQYELYRITLKKYSDQPLKALMISKRI